jgi:hypothetical protein
MISVVARSFVKLIPQLPFPFLTMNWPQMPILQGVKIPSDGMDASNAKRLSQKT